MPRRSFSFLRYAAAAAIIGLVTFGVIKWMGGNTSDKTTEGIAARPDSTRGNKQIDLTKENNTTENDTEKQDVTPAQDVVVINSDQSNASRIKKIKTRYSIADNIDATEPIYAYNEHTPNLADRYIMLMKPDGDIIRMSKKWGHLVCCVAGQEQDDDCKDQLKKWQEKLACSPLTTSPGNFMDILSLVNSINENEL
jgi:hypothetical protein